MVVLIVEFHVQLDYAQAFEMAVAVNARTSLSDEPGCRQFDVCRNASDPTRFMLYEVYDDDFAVQAHLESKHFQEMNEYISDWVVGKNVWRCERIAS